MKDLNIGVACYAKSLSRPIFQQRFLCGSNGGTRIRGHLMRFTILATVVLYDAMPCKSGSRWNIPRADTAVVSYCGKNDDPSAGEIAS